MGNSDRRSDEWHQPAALPRRDPGEGSDLLRPVGTSFNGQVSTIVHSEGDGSDQGVARPPSDQDVRRVGPVSPAIPIPQSPRIDGTACGGRTTRLCG